jgi:prevent-host-death family protein
MATTKLSSREFNQDTSWAKRAAKRGPVFVTDRGRPTHVLLTVEEYQKLTRGGRRALWTCWEYHRPPKLNLSHLA